MSNELVGDPYGRTILIVDPWKGPLGYFDWKEPDVRCVSLGALAQAQASIIRFRGFTKRPISVAEHASRVGRFAEYLAPEGCKDKAHMYGLLHDAHEALTPWGDVPSPWKTEEMKVEEARLDRFIWEALRFWRVHYKTATLDDFLIPEVIQAVKIADIAALYYEAITWQDGAEDWVTKYVSSFAGHEHALLARMNGDHDRLVATDPRNIDRNSWMHDVETAGDNLGMFGVE